MMSDIALFGGSFDPPHIGHLEIIENLHKSFDEVVIIPAYRNPFKESFYAPLQKRLSWMEELCAPFSNVSVSDFELQKNAKESRVVYAIDWVRFFAKDNANLTLVIGADNVQSLHKWKDFSELERLAKFLIINRESFESTTSYPTITIKNANISSTQIRDQILQGKNLQTLQGLQGFNGTLKNQILETYKGIK